MAAHRNRVRVRVRSFVTGEVLRFVSEREARFMCGENADGSDMMDMTGKPVEPAAHRLSRLKAPLEDIRLLDPVHRNRNSSCTLTMKDAEHNAMGKAFSKLGDTDSIRALDRAAGKVDSWPAAHDDLAVVVSAGKVYGVVKMKEIPDRVVSFL